MNTQETKKQWSVAQIEAYKVLITDARLAALGRVCKKAGVYESNIKKIVGMAKKDEMLKPTTEEVVNYDN